MNNQNQNLTSTQNCQKPIIQTSSWEQEELYPCANKRASCNGVVIGTKGQIPDKCTLDAYCDDCKKYFENKISDHIPPKARNADIYKCDQVIQDYYFKQFSLNKKGLYLWGKVGRGKSWAECAILKRLLFQGWEIKTIPMYEIYNELTEGQFRNSFSSSIYKKNLYDTGLLMIDDIGMEKMSDFRQETLESIIDGRYKLNKPTFFTSNYNPGELIYRVGGEIAGERIVSRIAETCEIIELIGEDRRLKN